LQSIDVPCILGCDCVTVKPTGASLPGEVNTTCLAYCNLDCVRKDATPAQLALAPSCWNICQAQHATLEKTGWCMYCCVDGYSDLVTSTPPAPGEPTNTMIDGHSGTLDPAKDAVAWRSWYRSQTAMPMTSIPVPAASNNAQPSTPSRSSGSKTKSAANFFSEPDVVSTALTFPFQLAYNGDPILQAKSLLFIALSLYFGVRIVCWNMAASQPDSDSTAHASAAAALRGRRNRLRVVAVAGLILARVLYSTA